ncbi:MAG: retropepsin-like aspartic protease [Myxococcota bacterium]
MTTLLLCLALPSGGLAVMLLTGAGLLHHAPGVLVALSAVTLVGLPAMGLASVVRGQVPGALGALILWSWVLIAGFPLYFPGERPDALAAGVGVIAGPLRVQIDPTLLVAVERRLPAAPSGRQPLPRLTPLPDENAVVSYSDGADGVVLRYSGQGRSMRVPVSIDDADGDRQTLWMIFDTGATLTTLDRATLSRLGVELPMDAPEVTLRTAAGERTAQTLILDRIWIGDVPVDGVTIAVCDACGDSDAAGLLGLNVSGRFRLTVDATEQELILQPRERADNSVDLSPWIDVQASATRFSDGRIEVGVSANSRAPRPVTDVIVAVRCDQSFHAELGDIAPGERAVARVALPLGVDCAEYSVAMVHGRW